MTIDEVLRCFNWTDMRYSVSTTNYYFTVVDLWSKIDKLEVEADGLNWTQLHAAKDSFNIDFRLYNIEIYNYVLKGL